MAITLKTINKAALDGLLGSLKHGSQMLALLESSGLYDEDLQKHFLEAFFGRLDSVDTTVGR
jgi:hypothetical protein